MTEVEYHPKHELIREERFPHVWCPGCGLGIELQCYLSALEKSGIPQNNHVLVSGIGCTARIPGYANLDTYHTTHGRGLPFATGMKIANPDLKVTVISGDGDLFNIGGNHFIHAARRNMDLLVICSNNFNYGMTGGQHGSTTPLTSKSASTPYGNIEPTFNLPYIASALGASYVARWTVMHPRQLTKSIRTAMDVKGFAFIEVLSPCPPNFGKFNGFKDGFEEMEFYRKSSVVQNDAKLEDISIDPFHGKDIVLGDFVNRKRASYITLEHELIDRIRGGGQ